VRGEQIRGGGQRRETSEAAVHLLQERACGKLEH
jgi:hypothetical protein